MSAPLGSFGRPNRFVVHESTIRVPLTASRTSSDSCRQEPSFDDRDSNTGDELNRELQEHDGIFCGELLALGRRRRERPRWSKANVKRRLNATIRDCGRNPNSITRSRKAN